MKLRLVSATHLCMCQRRYSKLQSSRWARSSSQLPRWTGGPSRLIFSISPGASSVRGSLTNTCQFGGRSCSTSVLATARTSLHALQSSVPMATAWSLAVWVSARGTWASRKLFAANGIDPERITDSTGESLPFPDESFDIVYSANVLEHTENPEQELREAVRVLRPGGALYIEIPNFLSYFEGHYMVVEPPILWKPMLAWWVKLVFRRDPAFARTLQTKINPIWCRRQIRQLSRTYCVEQVSLGEDRFLKRLAGAFVFEAEVVKGTIERLIKLVQTLNLGNWIGHLLVGLQAQYRIYLTLRKRPNTKPLP